MGMVCFSPFLKIGETFASFQKSGSFPESKDLWKISCRIGGNSLCKVCRTMGLTLSNMHHCVGSSLHAAFQCLQQPYLFQEFWVGDWTRMVGWHQSRANLAMISWKETLN